MASNTIVRVVQGHTKVDMAGPGARLALAAAERAEIAEAGAEDFAVSAGLSATAALVVSNLYPDTAAGLAAVAEGAYFAVAGPGDLYATAYRKVGGVAVEQKSFPSADAVWRKDELLDAEGADAVGFSHSVDYAAGTIGKRLKAFVCVTDAPFNCDPTGATNSSAGFLAASAVINAAGGGDMIIPRGTYKVGGQTFTGGPTYAYTPVQIIAFTNCTAPVRVIGSGAKLVCEAGMKYGSFDPVTGNRYDPPGSGAFTNTAYRATPYWAMIALSGCTGGVEISGLELDGNMTALTIGGRWNDTGIQIGMSGIDILDCNNVKVSRVSAHHHGLDGIMVRNHVLTAALPRNPVEIDNCIFEYNGRQGMSWTGGNCLTAINCRFAKTGRSVVASAPTAGLDIEAESSVTRNGMFINCEFSDNGGPGMVAHSASDNANFTFHRCKFVGTTYWSAMPNDPGFKFYDCLFVGGVTNIHSDAADYDASTQFHNCRFDANPALSETGTVYSSAYLTVEVTAEFALFNNCHFNSGGVTTKPVAYINNARVRDCQFKQDGTGIAVLRGTWAGRNFITTAGTVNSSGRQIMLGGMISTNGDEVNAYSTDVLAFDGAALRRFRIGAYSSPVAWASNFTGGAKTGDFCFNAASTGATLGWYCITAPGDTLAKWQAVVRVKQQTAPADPTGGATVDVECRAAVAAIIDLLQAGGEFL